MHYTTLGKTGLIVSRLALGTMTFGSTYGSIAKVNQAQAKELVAQALDQGVNLFDTANQYSGGQAEELLGKALGARRKSVVLATKVGLRMSETLLDAGLSARHILASVEASLKRLGTDYIDVLQLHLPDPQTPLEETVRTLDNLVRRGLVRYVGVCNFPAWQAATLLGLQQAAHLAPCVSLQLYYSLLNRDIEHEIVPFAQHAGLAILPWSPLAGGFLSGKYRRGDPSASQDRRATLDFPPIDLDLGYTVVEKLQEIASLHDWTPAQVALAWMLSKPFITSVIVGASTSSQLAMNLAAINLELLPEELQALDDLTAPAPLYPNWMLTMFPDRLLSQALAEKQALDGFSHNTSNLRTDGTRADQI